jgi:hypothetical protein
MTKWAGMWPSRAQAPQRNPAPIERGPAPPAGPRSNEPLQAGRGTDRVTIPEPSPQGTAANAPVVPTAPKETAAPPPARPVPPVERVEDPGARARVAERLRNAETAATSAREDALNADADVRSEALFKQGVRKEQEAASLRRAGKDEAAVQAFVAAADRFKKAGTEARLIAEDEEQERKKRGSDTSRGQTAPSPLPQKPPPLNLSVENPAVIQVLRRYERANNLTIKTIGEIRFMTGSDGRSWGTVPVTFVRGQEERAQLVSFERQGDAWVITDVR